MEENKYSSDRETSSLTRKKYYTLKRRIRMNLSNKKICKTLEGPIEIEEERNDGNFFETKQ